MNAEHILCEHDTKNKFQEAKRRFKINKNTKKKHTVSQLSCFAQKWTEWRKKFQNKWIVDVSISGMQH